MHDYMQPNKWNDETMKHNIAIDDFTFPQPSSHMFRMQCREHPECEYLTKHPALRTLFYVSNFVRECACPLSNLIVILDDDEYLQYVASTIDTSIS